MNFKNKLREVLVELKIKYEKDGLNEKSRIRKERYYRIGSS